jgi:hypothetical protein
MADKRFDPEDPMEMMAVGLPCSSEDYDAMVEAIIEEFFWMGWPDETIFHMFEHSFYQLPHAVLKQRGEPYVRDAIRRVREAWRPKGIEGGIHGPRP